MMSPVSQALSSILTVVGIGVFLGIVPASGADSSTSPVGTPLACHPQALSEAEWKRHAELRDVLFAAVTERTELPTGLDFTFDPKEVTIVQLAQWVDGERRCCPFIEFEIRQPADGGPLSLRLSGRPGVKELIQMELGGK